MIHGFSINYNEKGTVNRTDKLPKEIVWLGSDDNVNWEKIDDNISISNFTLGVDVNSMSKSGQQLLGTTTNGFVKTSELKIDNVPIAHPNLANDNSNYSFFYESNGASVNIKKFKYYAFVFKSTNGDSTLQFREIELYGQNFNKDYNNYVVKINTESLFEEQYKSYAVIITKLLANSTTQNISKVNYVDFEQEPNTLKSLLNSKLLMDTYLSTNNWFHVIEFSETFYYKHYAIQFIDTQVDTNGNIPQIRDLEFYGLYNTSLNSGFNKLNSIIKTNDVLFPNKLEYNNENLDSIIITEQVKNIKVFNYDVDGNDHFYDNTMLSGMAQNNYRYGKKDIFKVFNNLIDNSTPNYIIRNEVWTYSNTLNNFINDMRSVHIELDFIESKRIEYMTIIAYNRKIDNIRLFLDTSYSFVKKEIQLNFTYDQKNISITSVKEYISKLNALGLKSRIFENDSNTLSQCYLTIIKLNHQFRDMKKLNFFITDLIEEENNNQPLALSNIELFERKLIVPHH